MSITELYSQREKRLRDELPHVLQFYGFTYRLRKQIIFIIRKTIGTTYLSHAYVEKAYRTIHEQLCMEYGRDFLFLEQKGNFEADIFAFIENTLNDEEILDVVQLFFSYMINVIKVRKSYKDSSVSMTPDEAVYELNYRFKENGFGYQFIDNYIIRMDSTYIYEEIVVPTIQLLHNMEFSGAEDEYLSAHDHYRNGRNKECLNECLKTLESVLKTICRKNDWIYNEKDTVRRLLQICFEKNLVPEFIKKQFSLLPDLIESGVPIIRNRLSGHGQGVVPKDVDDEMARYALNLTGTNVVFLVESSLQLK